MDSTSLLTQASESYDQSLRQNSTFVLNSYLPQKLAESSWGDDFPTGWFFPQKPFLIRKTDRQELEKKLRFLFEIILQIPQKIFRSDLDLIGTSLRIPQPTLEIIRDFYPRQKGFWIGRPDTLWTPNSWGVVEANVSSVVGGAASIDLYQKYFFGLPFWKEWSEKFKIEFLNPLNSFLSSFKEWLKKIDFDFSSPLIFIDPYGDRDPEKILIPLLMQHAGIPVVKCLPEDLTLRGDQLFFEGKRVRVLFPYVNDLEIFSQFYRYERILHSAECGEVILVKELSDLILDHKGIFTFLSDSKFKDYFTSFEWDFLQRTIPWTRWIEKISTTLETESVVSLVSYVENNQKDLVIKAPYGMQGMSVWLGNEITEDVWQKLIAQALDEGDWIVQRRLTLPFSRFPYFLDNKLEFQDVQTMLLPFFYENLLGGFAMRTSIPEKSLKLTFPEHGNTGVAVVAEIDC